MAELELITMGESASQAEFNNTSDLYQFRLHRNDGESGVGSRESGNVELLTLTLSFPCNRKRYEVVK